MIALPIVTIGIPLLNIDWYSSIDQSGKKGQAFFGVLPIISISRLRLLIHFLRVSFVKIIL